MNQEDIFNCVHSIVPVVHHIPPKTESRPWGSWTLLHEAPGVKIKLIEVQPGHRLSLQYHYFRSEFWVCLSGTATAVIGEDGRELEFMGTAVIPAGTVHRLANNGQLPVLIVEIQNGEKLIEEDIIRLEDDYHRADISRQHSS